ncbi:hypothetical protein CP533_3202 [Ophiocordyceps camponoti-saundersi (nom. inval.)]|nr:hypothetical protein CP533_3202 [Ophiocordyceps camponoti-saundersi (nom. inval.)]
MMITSRLAILSFALSALVWLGNSSGLQRHDIAKRSPPPSSDSPASLYAITTRPPTKSYRDGLSASAPFDVWDGKFDVLWVGVKPVQGRRPTPKLAIHSKLDAAIKSCREKVGEELWASNLRLYIYEISKGPDIVTVGMNSLDQSDEVSFSKDEWLLSTRILSSTSLTQLLRGTWTTKEASMHPLLNNLQWVTAEQWFSTPIKANFLRQRSRARLERKIFRDKQIELEREALRKEVERQTKLESERQDIRDQLRRMLETNEISGTSITIPEPDDSYIYVQDKHPDTGPSPRHVAYVVSSQNPLKAFRKGIRACLTNLSMLYGGVFQTTSPPGPMDAPMHRFVVAYKDKHKAIKAFAANNLHEWKSNRGIWIYEVPSQTLVPVPPDWTGNDDVSFPEDRLLCTNVLFGSVIRAAGLLPSRRNEGYGSDWQIKFLVDTVIWMRLFDTVEVRPIRPPTKSIAEKSRAQDSEKVDDPDAVSVADPSTLSSVTEAGPRGSKHKLHETEQPTLEPSVKRVKQGSLPGEMAAIVTDAPPTDTSIEAERLDVRSRPGKMMSGGGIIYEANPSQLPPESEGYRPTAGNPLTEQPPTEHPSSEQLLAEYPPTVYSATDWVPQGKPEPWQPPYGHDNLPSELPAQQPAGDEDLPLQSPQISSTTWPQRLPSKEANGMFYEVAPDSSNPGPEISGETNEGSLPFDDLVSSAPDMFDSDYESILRHLDEARSALKERDSHPDPEIAGQKQQVSIEEGLDPEALDTDIGIPTSHMVSQEELDKVIEELGKTVSARGKQGSILGSKQAASTHGQGTINQATHSMDSGNVIPEQEKADDDVDGLLQRFDKSELARKMQKSRLSSKQPSSSSSKVQGTINQDQLNRATSLTDSAHASAGPDKFDELGEILQTIHETEMAEKKQDSHPGSEISPTDSKGTADDKDFNPVIFLMGEDFGDPAPELSNDELDELLGQSYKSEVETEEPDASFKPKVETREPSYRQLNKDPLLFVMEKTFGKDLEELHNEDIVRMVMDVPERPKIVQKESNSGIPKQSEEEAIDELVALLDGEADDPSSEQSLRNPTDREEGQQSSSIGPEYEVIDLTGDDDDEVFQQLEPEVRNPTKINPDEEVSLLFEESPETLVRESNDGSANPVAVYLGRDRKSTSSTSSSNDLATVGSKPTDQDPREPVIKRQHGSQSSKSKPPSTSSEDAKWMNKLQQLPQAPKEKPSRRKGRKRRKSGSRRKKEQQLCCPKGGGSLRKRDCIPCVPEVKGRTREEPKTKAENGPMRLKELADKKTAEEFRALAEKLEIPAAEASLPELRRKMNQVSSTKKWAQKWGAAMALTAASLPLYIMDVVEAFRSNTTTTADKLATTLSIVPIVGCSTQLNSDLQYDKTGAIGAANALVCITADALLFTPLMPLAIVMHVVQGIIREIPLLQKPKVQASRDREWDRRYGQIVDYYKSGDWANKMKTWYTAELAAVAYVVSQERGMLAAGAEMTISGSNHTLAEEGRQLQLAVSQRYNETEQALCSSIQFLVRRAKRLAPGKDWLLDQADRLNGDFISQYSKRAKIAILMGEDGRLMSPSYSIIRRYRDVSEQRRLEEQIKPVIDHLMITPADVKTNEFAAMIQSLLASVIVVPPQCSCSASKMEIESIINEDTNPSVLELEKTMLCASSRRYKDVVEKLTSLLISPNTPDEKGNTALMLASEKGYGDIVDVLLKSGRGPMQNSATLEAIKRIFWIPGWVVWNTVVGLYRGMARVKLHSRNKDGDTALSLAERNGHEEVVKMLRAAQRVD